MGENCKYNGGNNKNEAVCRFIADKEFITVCPECMGGLSTPRNPAEITAGNFSGTCAGFPDMQRGRRVFSNKGEEVTLNFYSGAQKALEAALRFGGKVCVLKESSPSCGVNNIYDGTFSGKKIKGRGIAAELFLKEGFTLYSEKDIEEILRGNKDA